MGSSLEKTQTQTATKASSDARKRFGFKLWGCLSEKTKRCYAEKEEKGQVCEKANPTRNVGLPSWDRGIKREQWPPGKMRGARGARGWGQRGSPFMVIGQKGGRGT